MADIVTGTVSGQVDVSGLHSEHAHIRREIAEDTCKIESSVKEAGWNTINRVESTSDRLSDQGTAYYIAGQNVNFQNASAIAALKASTDAQFSATQFAIQLEAAKNATATALGQSSILQAITNDGNSTRALINSNTIEELRNKAILDKIDCCCEKHHGNREGRREGVLNFGAPLSAQVPM